jgi:hypothetical protein
MVSHFNDNRPPKRTPDIDSKVKALPSRENLSRFGALLEGAINAIPSDRILIVITEMMKADPQAVMNDVYDFIGH